jgi:ADP-heptose:LPS heptosyltransferase/GT2 family glycosyltransferase
VAILFGEYELLAKSGLFDPEYYIRANPDVAALNIDPLVHYLETGCREGRNPSAEFDTSYYLRQCHMLGEIPSNALAHYLNFGADRGLRSQPPTASPAADGLAGKPIGHDRNQDEARNNLASSEAAVPHVRLLSVDVPKSQNGVPDIAVHGGLSIAGWALARDGIASVEVALDGRRAAVAYYGIRRPDVAAAFQDWPDCLQSGYAAHVPPKVLTGGRHIVTITARDRRGGTVGHEFAIDVKELAEDRGPWSLRRKMSQVEANLQLSLLRGLHWHPLFRVILPLAIDAEDMIKARRSLASLSHQTYRTWQLCLVPGDAATATAPQRGRARAALIEQFEGFAEQVVVLNERGAASRGAETYVVRMAAGDELSCDALLEFALSSAVDRKAELLYCDERRTNPVDNKAQAFFKPQWSPDLLLSTNYIGRAWCVQSRLLKRIGISLRELVRTGDYEIVLQLTESAQGIRHVAKLLYQRADDCAERDSEELQALSEALRRRDIAGEVQQGCAPHYYRVQRKNPKQSLVSIIVPTCASRGLIRTCIESLRGLTAYRDFEIICIENIAADQRQWKNWLAKNADIVLEADEPFNWSRYNNRAATRATGEHLLFLNDDIEIIEPDWLDAMLEHVQRPEVGVVGPQLLYPDRTVQHAGLTLDREGRGRHVFRFQQQNGLGYFGLALTQRNVIGVTGACLMTRRDTFDKLDRFQEEHAITNGDLDFCLRSWHSGLLNIYTPHARLIHHELASRSQLEDRYNAQVFHDHWQTAIRRGDPYFNPNLALEQDQIVIEREPVEEIYAGTPLFDANKVHRVLIVKLDHIGDCITALPAVQRLKQAFPVAKITVLAGGGTLSIWQAEPSVDEVTRFDFFHARSGLGVTGVADKALVELGQLLRKKEFDLAIDLRKQPDTRHLLQLSGARILAGFDHQGRFPWLDVALEWDEDVPLRTKRAHVTTDLMALVNMVVAGSETLARPITSTKSPVKLSGAAVRKIFSKPLVCVHPAAGSEMRQWPLEKFSELIDGLLDRGQLHVAIIGGPDEAEIARQVLSRIARREQVFDLVGKVSIGDLPKLIARATLFVGNNSGPQHMAAALGVPTVGIHSGVVDAHEWGPAGPRAMAIRRNMSCSPCFIERAKDCPRALVCLTGLDSREVLTRCVRLLPPSLGRGSARG